MLLQGGADRVERLRVDRIALIEPVTHPLPLRTLPGENKTEPADGSRGRRATEDTGRLAALGHGGETGQELGPVGAEDDGAVLQCGSGGGQRPADVGRV